MKFSRQKIINTSFTVIILFLTLPATAILASWNSLPGSTLYPVKRGLEKTALFLLPNSLLEMDFRLKLLDRRFNEAILALFDNHSDQGLKAIVEEARMMELAFEDLAPKTQVQVQIKIVSKLKQTSQKLEQVQQQHLIPVHPPNQPPAAPPPQNPIDETQADLDDIIKNLEKRVSELELQLNTPSAPPAPSTPPAKTLSPSDADTVTPSPVLASPIPSPEPTLPSPALEKEKEKEKHST